MHLSQADITIPAQAHEVTPAEGIDHDYEHDSENQKGHTGNQNVPWLGRPGAQTEAVDDREVKLQTRKKLQSLILLEKTKHPFPRLPRLCIRSLLVRFSRGLD